MKNRAAHKHPKADEFKKAVSKPELIMLTVRIPKALMKKLKKYCLENEQTQREVTTSCLDSLLS